MGLFDVVSLISIAAVVAIDEGVEGEDDNGDDEVDGDGDDSVEVDEVTVDSVGFDDKGEEKVDDTGDEDGGIDTGVVEGNIETALTVVVVVLLDVEGLGLVVEPSAGVSSNGTSLPLTKASEI